MPEETARKSKPWGFWRIFGAVFVIWIVIQIFTSGSRTTPRPSAPSGPAPNDPALLTQCQELIQAGYDNGVIREVVYSPDHTRVVVGRMFYEVDFSAKVGWCRAISYVAKSRGGPGDFIIRDSRTNKQVGSLIDGALNLY